MVAESSKRRAQCKIARVLSLIDCLASFARPKSVTDLFIDDGVRQLYSCRRTLYRDLELLLSMEMVIESGSKSLQFFELDLKRSERLQLVAMNRPA